MLYVLVPTFFFFFPNEIIEGDKVPVIKKEESMSNAREPWLFVMLFSSPRIKSESEYHDDEITDGRRGSRTEKVTCTKLIRSRIIMTTRQFSWR